MEGTMTAKRTKDTGERKGFHFETGLGGLFKGLGDMVDTLAELAEKGEALKKEGQFLGTHEGKELKGVYGFCVKVGLGGEGLKVEPFGNVHKNTATGEAVVSEVREPMVDVFEEKDHVLVVAEMPGIGEKDLHLDLKDDLLILSAEKGNKRYRKEVLLPGTFRREAMTVSCNNGVVEIKCLKTAGARGQK
jgi:HSP20 family protein